MMVDWTLDIGNIVQLVTLVGAAGSVFIGISYRIKNVERELEKLASVVVTLAIQKTEIEHLRQRIEDLSRTYAPPSSPLRSVGG
jgi:divalent metal cation (Fe/Co/Zn/Cd) transporter